MVILQSIIIATARAVAGGAGDGRTPSNSSDGPKFPPVWGNLCQTTTRYLPLQLGFKSNGCESVPLMVRKAYWTRVQLTFVHTGT
jgi:hypothetical protein